MDDEKVYAGLMSVLDRYDIGIVKGKHQEPIYIPADDPLIKTLMDIYEAHTGDTESKPLVIGGGTYARAIPNTVAFGARFPDEIELGHQKDERFLWTTWSACKDLCGGDVSAVGTGRIKG